MRHRAELHHTNTSCVTILKHLQPVFIFECSLFLKETECAYENASSVWTETPFLPALVEQGPYKSMLQDCKVLAERGRHSANLYQFAVPDSSISLSLRDWHVIWHRDGCWWKLAHCSEEMPGIGTWVELEGEELDWRKGMPVISECT